MPKDYDFLKNNMDKFCILLLCCLLQSVIATNLKTKPENIVALKEGSASMTFSIGDATDELSVNILKGTKDTKVIYTYTFGNGKIYDKTGAIDITDSGGDFNLTFSQLGVDWVDKYSFQIDDTDFEEEIVHAYIVVIDSLDVSIEENQHVSTTATAACELKYVASEGIPDAVTPGLTAYKNEVELELDPLKHESVLDPDSKITTVTNSYDISFTIEDNGKSFACETYTLVPDFTLKRDTTIKVFWPPKISEMNVTSPLVVGSSLNCSVDAKPTASVYWFKTSDESSKVEGNLLEIATTMLESKQNWTCMAENTFNDISYSDSKDVVFSVISAENIAAQHEWKIAVGVTVPLLLLLILAGVILFLVFFRKRPSFFKKKNPPKTDTENAENPEGKNNDAFLYTPKYPHKTDDNPPIVEEEYAVPNLKRYPSGNTYSNQPSFDDGTDLPTPPRTPPQTPPMQYYPSEGEPRNFQPVIQNYQNYPPRPNPDTSV